MEARLQLRQSQRLVMTPMLQQAIQLLQLSTLELQELLQKELTENPMLEEAPADEPPAPEAVGDAPVAETPPAEPPSIDATPEAPPELPFDITEIMFGPPDERTLVQQETPDETRFENIAGAPTSLSDHLDEQLRLSDVDPGIREMVEYIIGNLDEDGYVPATLLFDRALDLVQSFDPPGVGSRDLQECLVIQASRRSPSDPVAVWLLRNHWDAFVRHDEGGGQPALVELAWSDRWENDRLRSEISRAFGIEREATPLLEKAVRDQMDKVRRLARSRNTPDSEAQTKLLGDLARAIGVDDVQARETVARLAGTWERRVEAGLDFIAGFDRKPGRGVPPPDSPSTHLGQQLDGRPVWPDLRTAAATIIGHLDTDGYLRADLDDLVAQTALPGYERALAAVQALEPTGVGARTVRECLLIQLRDRGDADPLAVQILEDHFAAFQRCKYPDIARALRCDPERVLEAVDEIATLEPKPGRRFADADTRYVVPDVHVVKVDDDYAIVLNEDGIPRLRINSYYRSIIGRAEGDEARKYVEDRLRSAVWLIKSVHQRQKTLYKVTKSIVQFQRAFLEHGTSRLRPLSLRHVAEDIQMHESTVSRVTTNKYVQTPQGLFELKFFFHSGIAKDHGDDVSSVSVKQMIGQLVAKEDAARPLSDQDITHALKQRGLNIARRTVAKYREELAILPSHRRRLAIRRRS